MLGQTSGKGLTGILFFGLIFFVWAPFYLYKNWDLLIGRYRAETIAFGVSVIVAALLTWGFFEFTKLGAGDLSNKIVAMGGVSLVTVLFLTVRKLLGHKD